MSPMSHQEKDSCNACISGGLGQFRLSKSAWQPRQFSQGHPGRKRRRLAAAGFGDQLACLRYRGQKSAIGSRRRLNEIECRVGSDGMRIFDVERLLQLPSKVAWGLDAIRVDDLESARIGNRQTELFAERLKVRQSANPWMQASEAGVS
jgi:hypothetical protein